MAKKSNMKRAGLKPERRPDIEIIVEKFRRDTAVLGESHFLLSPPAATRICTHLFPLSYTATMNDCARRRIYFSVCYDFNGGGIFIAMRGRAPSAK